MGSEIANLTRVQLPGAYIPGSPTWAEGYLVLDAEDAWGWSLATETKASQHHHLGAN